MPYQRGPRSAPSSPLARHVTGVPTQYQNIWFRSKLEARTARLHDTVGISWLYENRLFALGDGTWYLPDFWLPDQRVFLETKGVLDQASAHKVVGLASTGAQESTPFCVIMLTSPTPRVGLYGRQKCIYAHLVSPEGIQGPDSMILVSCISCSGSYWQTTMIAPFSCPSCHDSDHWIPYYSPTTTRQVKPTTRKKIRS